MSDTANPNPGVDMRSILETSEDTLSDSQKQVYSLLTTLLSEDGEEGSLAWMFAGLEDVIHDFQDDLLSALPGSSLLAGAGEGGEASAAALKSAASGFPSKNITVTPQLHPKPEHLYQLPVEFSMGYLLIYDQLVKMAAGSEEAKKKKETSGIGGFFSNLLKGAEGLALIAVGLLAFTGAMFLFQFIQWDPALKGLAAFTMFTVGMVIIAKILGNNMKDFRTFAEGVLLMTAGIILFNVAIWISAKIIPYWPAARQTIEAYMIFVGLMAGVATLLKKELGNFKSFAFGVVILIAGILLFNVAIITSAIVGPLIPAALTTLGLFALFVAGAAVLASALDSLIAPFALMAVAIVLLDAALLLFGLVIKQYSKIAGDIPAARNALLQSSLLIGEIALLATAAAILMPGLALFAAGILAISAAFIAWGAALAVLGLVSGKIPAAKLGVTASIDVLKTIAALGLSVAPALVVAVAFAASLITISAAFATFSLMLVQLSMISSQIGTTRTAITNIAGVLDLLTSTMANFSAKGAAEFSRNLELVRNGLKKLTAEEKEVDKLTKSLEKLSKAMQAPDKTLWDVLPGSLSGGIRASTGEGPAGGVAAPQAKNGNSVDLERHLKRIIEFLDNWDLYVKKIGTAEITNIPTVVVASATRTPGVDGASVKAPLK